MSSINGSRVGAMRPSQLMWSYGIGAMIDLPRLSVMVDGVERWNTTNARPIPEERLLAAVRHELGGQVERLLEPPLPEEEVFGKPPDDPVHKIGVPVGIFPGWLRCPRCGLLSGHWTGVFTAKGSSTRPDDIRFEHEGCSKRGKGRAPACVPARFVTACRAGHLDDFPWREYVHRGRTTCDGTLRFFEIGSSLETVNLYVACDQGTGFSDSGEGREQHQGAADGCGAPPRSMVDAVGERGDRELPRCRGRHPHLRHAEGACAQQLKTVLLGSSSSWFPQAISALSIPIGSSELEQEIQDHWDDFGEVEGESDLQFLRRKNALGAATPFSDDEILAAIESVRTGATGPIDTEDMKIPEWRVFAYPDEAPEGEDFLLTEGDIPEGFDGLLDSTVLLEKVREVNALVGFTRLEAPEELIYGDDDLTYAPLSINPPTWVPANEVRGEGILIRFNEAAVREWESSVDVNSRLEQLREANNAWRIARDLAPGEGYPGHRHVLIHSFSHMIMRELALECGYSSTSIRERLYASIGEDEESMAGVLIYTAAPDSEGTLGGLVRLGERQTLGRLIRQALEHARLCAADPLCSEHDPVPDRSLHAAACHACTFAPETACEKGNRFLDRAAVVPTIAAAASAYFDG